MFTVFHRVGERSFRPVAMVKVDSPEEAFRLTNHGGGRCYWTDNDELYPIEGSVRSTSVGDFMIRHDGVIFIIEQNGMREISQVAEDLREVKL